MTLDPREAIQLAHYRIRLRLTREGLIYLVVLTFVAAGALFRNVNLLILLSGMMLVPVLLGWRLAMVMLSGMELRRSFPSRLLAGQSIPMTWRLTNNRRTISVWQIQIQDRVCHETGTPSQEVRLIANEVKPLQSEFEAFRAFFGQRGQYYWDRVTVSSRFPLGLVEAHCELPASNPFTVGPAVGTLVANWDRRLLSKASGTHSRARRRGMTDDEFFALRPWRGGDPRRYIHWRSSARHQELMVKQFDNRSDRDLVLLLDLYESRESRQAESMNVPAIEHVLSFGATLLTHALGLVKGKVGLAICGAESVMLADYASGTFVDEALNELGRAAGSDHPDVMSGLMSLAGEVSGGTPFYIVSTRPRQDLAALVPGVHWHRFRAIEPWLRWLTVDTAEMNELFQSPYQTHAPATWQPAALGSEVPIAAGEISDGPR